MTDSSKAVFLSYASQDAEAARRICDALRAAGIEVWFDQSELRGGDAWDLKIRTQIRDCALFIPIVSANTDARPQGYFRLEWKLAVDHSHLMSDRVAFLVPAVIDDTRDQDADVPDAFRAVQWTRLTDGTAPPAFVERVSRLLAHDLPVSRPQAGPPAGRTAAPQHLGSTRAASRLTAPVLLLVALTVAVIGAGYLAVDKFVLSKRVAVGTQASVVAGATAQGEIPEKSIAVLPFVDMSEKHDQEYFGDGMAEEILNLLTRIPELKVIGRTSSFRFKGKTDDLRKIGTTLGAAYVVEGSVRRSGDHVRVTGQLIDTRDGAHRWSETYDRDVSDILKVQGEIAASLVRALQLEVTSLTSLQQRALPKSPETYDSYLRGMHALNRFDQRGFETAAADFRHALEIDPAFVPAAEWLSRALGLLADWGFVAPQTGWDQARTAAEAALRLDPKSALARAVLGKVYTLYDWNWQAAEREMKTAVALAPNDPVVLLTAAQEPIAVGRWTDAVRLLEASIAVDPLGPSAHELMSFAYVRLGRFADAESTFRRLLEISPSYAYAHYGLGLVLLEEGNAQAALAELQKEGPIGAQLAGLVVVYSALHRNRESDVALARLEATFAGSEAVRIAEAYAFRGQMDQALRWLERAYAEKNVWLWLIKGDPLLKNLEKDARYKAFLRKMNLPE